MKANVMFILSIFFGSKIVQALFEKNFFKLDAAFAIFKSATRFLVYFDFMHYLRHENSYLKKNAFYKIESLCHADSKHIFGLQIVQVLS
jgi:hypothetical protein